MLGWDRTPRRSPFQTNDVKSARSPPVRQSPPESASPPASPPKSASPPLKSAKVRQVRQTSPPVRQSPPVRHQSPPKSARVRQESPPDVLESASPPAKSATVRQGNPPDSMGNHRSLPQSCEKDAPELACTPGQPLLPRLAGWTGRSCPANKHAYWLTFETLPRKRSTQTELS